MENDDDDFVLILGEIERLKKVQMDNGKLNEIKGVLSAVLFAHNVDEKNAKDLIVPMLQLISKLLNSNNLFIKNN